MFKNLPKANIIINAMKQTCEIIILAFYSILFNMAPKSTVKFFLTLDLLFKKNDTSFQTFKHHNVISVHNIFMEGRRRNVLATYCHAITSGHILRAFQRLTLKMPAKIHLKTLKMPENT